MIRMAAILAVIVGAAGTLQAGTGAGGSQTIDKASSRIEFHAKATFTKVVGVFESWEAELKVPGDSFEGATLHLKLDSDSVSTGNGMKDKEIKNKNFFDVKQFPEIEFAPTKVTPGPDPAKFVMEGNLTMRGITKPVTVMITVHPVVEGHQMIDGEIAFNRRDFGMTHNVPFNKVANEVEVEMHLNVVKSGAAGAEK